MLAKYCEGARIRMEPKYVYIFLKQNRHGILNRLWHDDEDHSNANEVHHNDEGASDNSDGSSCGDDRDPSENSTSRTPSSTISFSVTLSLEKWKSLYQPNPVMYRSTDRNAMRKK